MPSNTTNQSVKSSVNDQSTIKVLLEADLEKAISFLDCGLLNFKLPFTCNDDKKYSIWHILILRKEPKNTAFLKAMFLEYQKKYRHDVIPEELNKSNENGLTPALLAAFVGNLEGIRILCAAGADPTIKDTIDGTDITCMLIKNYIKLLPELEQILQDYRSGKYRLPPPLPVPPPAAIPTINTKSSNKENIFTSVYSGFSKVSAFFTACSTPVDNDESQQKLLANTPPITTEKKVQ